MISRDIQKELYDLCAGMTTRNIYSQLTYFIVELATAKENPCDAAHEIAMIIGLISDSYLGMTAYKGKDFKKENL